MEEKKLKILSKAIRNSEHLNYAEKQFLLDYVDGVKEGSRFNDFYDVDFLTAVILRFVNGDIIVNENESIEYVFQRIVEDTRFFLPMGDKTEDYEKIKSVLINSDGFFDKELFSLINNPSYYNQIISMINSCELSEYAKKLVHSFAIDVSPYCNGIDELKANIVSFINSCKNEVSDNYDDVYKTKIIEAQKKCGIYPLGEDTLEEINSAVERLRESIEYLKAAQIRTSEYDKKVKAITEEGRKELENIVKRSKADLRNEIESLKVELINKLNDYLLELEEMLKNSSDQVFNKILKDAQGKLNDIKLMIRNLSTTTTNDLLRIKEASEDSVDKLRDYLENEPKLKQLLEESIKSSRVKEVILSTAQSGAKIKVEEPSTSEVEVSNVRVPGGSRIIVPATPDVNIPANIVIPKPYQNKILPAFDENIPFDKRYQKIMDEKDRREKNGEIFHSCIDEVITCIMEGDWPYLWGPSGSGKSYLVRQVASLLGIDMLENGKITDKYSIMAYNDPQGRFRATQAFVALVFGKLLLLDEFDNGNTDTQVVLNELYSGLLDVIDNPDKERYVTFAEDTRVPINRNFRLISAGNTNCNGANQIYSSRGKIDESVQERMTPKYFGYDKRVEEGIFGKYDEWYNFFIRFREACDAYANELSLSSAPGMITTRDASAIVKYIKHNSKTVDQIIREKFIQTKNPDYLSRVAHALQEKYQIKDYEIKDPNELKADLDRYELSDINGKQLALTLISNSR